MKLVLVAGLSPRVAKFGAKVRLFAGRWKIATEHQIDSVLMLHSEEGVRTIAHGTEFETNGGCFQVEFVNGSESFVNIFAEFLSGSLAPEST